MYSLKERLDTPSVTPTKPILAAKRRRQLHPFFFRMGPVALCITSVLLIALMAVLYLSQCGQALAANQQIQKIRDQQSMLRRQNQDLVDIVAQEQSPVYISAQASKLGLVPADPKNVQVLVVPRLQPLRRDNDQQLLP
jgi:cell division protein FtsL